MPHAAPPAQLLATTTFICPPATAALRNIVFLGPWFFLEENMFFKKKTVTLGGEVCERSGMAQYRAASSAPVRGQESV
jgi:hypothetical protein